MDILTRHKFVSILLVLFSLVAVSSVACAADSDSLPLGQSESASTTELFGLGKGYLHPSVTLVGNYDDNYYSTDSDEEGDFSTLITPALWISLPATQNTFIPLVSSNDSPGGQGVTRFKQDDNLGFQAALYYSADLEYHHDHSADDVISQNGQGLLQYGLASGLTFEISDVYLSSYDSYDEDSDASVSDYNSNLVNGIVYYQVNPSLKLRAGYSLYELDYDESVYAYRERDDQTASVYAMYQVLPKTEAFIQYDHIGTDFDLESREDMTFQNSYVGLKFDSRAKIDGFLKVGYGYADADDESLKDYHDFIGEAELGYAISSKNKLSLNAYRSVDVSTDSDYLSILNNYVSLTLDHEFTQKISASVYGLTKSMNYRGDTEVANRRDKYFGSGVNVKYLMQEWMVLDLGYDFITRSSNVSGNDYNNNSVLLSLTLAY